MKFLQTIKGCTKLFLISFFIINVCNLNAQSTLPDLSAIQKNEKKLLQFKSAKLPSNANRDNYLAYVNSLSQEIDLREKIKNQYIKLESELLLYNTEEKKNDILEPIKTIQRVSYSNLKSDVYNAVLNDKIFQEKLKQEKKDHIIRAMYLNQVLKSNNESIVTIAEPAADQNSKETSIQNSVDSLHAVAITKITTQEDKINTLNTSMKEAMDYLLDNTKVVQKSSTQNYKTPPTNKPVVNPLNRTVVNIQNVLRQPQVSGYNFRVNYAVDNKLMEDRKGFMSCPLSQGIRSIRYEEKINGRKHDGVVFTSKSSTVSNISQGTVVKVGQSTAGKKYVVVKHDGDYMSVYANLKEVYVSENEYIKFKGNLGQANSYNGNTFAIHFQIWKGSQSLNPSRWIKNN